MMVIAKMTAVTVDQVLLSYGSGLDGATPNIRVNALDHLIVGFSGTGWTADIGSPIGSQSGFFCGYAELRRGQPGLGGNP